MRPRLLCPSAEAFVYPPQVETRSPLVLTVESIPKGFLPNSLECTKIDQEDAFGMDIGPEPPSPVSLDRNKAVDNFLSGDGRGRMAEVSSRDENQRA
jgi:hypothetical protein